MPGVWEEGDIIAEIGAPVARTPDRITFANGTYISIRDSAGGGHHQVYIQPNAGPLMHNDICPTCHAPLLPGL
jgi:hypothetical protein